MWKRKHKMYIVQHLCYITVHTQRISSTHVPPSINIHLSQRVQEPCPLFLSGKIMNDFFIFKVCIEQVIICD